MPWGVVAGAAIGAIGSAVGGHAQQQGAEAAANASKDQFNTTNAQQQPFIQSGYGALNRLNYLLGIGPQTASGAPVNSSSGGSNGIDPSSGYRIGAGGGISQGISGGGNSPPAYTGNHASAGFSQNGMSLGEVPGSGAQGSSAPGASYPAGGGAASPSAGGPGYGSLTAAFTPQDYLNNQDPGYQFQLQQGTQALRNASAAGSGALSGAALKDLIGYNQDYAKTGYASAFDRFNTQNNNIYSRLSGLATLGQASAGNVAAQGTALAGQQSQALQAGGNAAGGMYAGIANNVGSGVSNYWLSQTPAGQQALGTGGA
jgi:hypothetical protein